MNRLLMQGTFVFAITFGALSVAGPAAAHPTPDTYNFGSHVAHCARHTGFSGDHNPSMHRDAAGSHICHTGS